VFSTSNSSTDLDSQRVHGAIDFLAGICRSEPFMSTFKAIVRRWSAISRLARARSCHARRLLTLEQLEGRAVPSTLLVTTLLDSGQGSLRAAVEAANRGASHAGAGAPSYTIKFAHSVRGTILLTNPMPVLLTHILIAGPGPSVLTVARSDAPGTAQFRPFTVGTGARIAMSGLTITNGLTIDGGGIDNAGTLSLKNMWITGNSASGVFSAGGAAGGGIYNTGTLSITKSRFANNTVSGGSGHIFGDPASGGAISNSGRLSVTSSTFVGNTAIAGQGIMGGGFARGGAIDNSGRLSISGHSTFISNSVFGGLGGAANALGGAIDNSNTLSITGATFSLNSAGGSQGSPLSGQGEGGAIESGGNFSISSSTFNGNLATGSNAYGGAIHMAGKVSVTKSTFSGNAARSTGNSGGGAIYSEANLAGVLSVTGSTFTGNMATSDTFIGDGGAIFSQGTLLVTNSTFTGNAAAGAQSSSGGGIASAGVLALSYDTLAGNSAATGGGVATIWGAQSAGSSIDSIFQNSQGGNVAVVTGSFASLGHNLFSDVPSISLNPTDIVNSDPLLRPLASNGGPTQTEALAPGSPAIKKGIVIPGITTDQRGARRPRHRATDIGAFQL
jgi:hypothetical protein